jgi:ParB/RepB/Spo0J family partition protein
MPGSVNDIELKKLEPEKIAFNKYNPRDESADEIADDEEYERLKDSVYKYGVLVPIVVHRQSDPVKPYLLVDGERRLRAALDTNTQFVPAHIAPVREQLDELIQAVHIHMLRKQWKPIARARVLKKIRQLYKRENPQHSETELVNYLKEMMACTETHLKSLRRVAKYPEQTLKEVEQGTIDYSHLVQFEESLIEPLEEKYPSLLKKMDIKQVRKALVNKARMKVLGGTRDLMYNVAPVLARAKTTEQKKCAEKLVSEFVRKEDMQAKQVLEIFNQQFPPDAESLLEASSNIIDMSQQLVLALERLDSSELNSLPKQKRDLKKSLETLRAMISNKLKSIRRS